MKNNEEKIQKEFKSPSSAFKIYENNNYHNQQENKDKDENKDNNTNKDTTDTETTLLRKKTNRKIKKIIENNYEVSDNLSEFDYLNKIFFSFKLCNQYLLIFSLL